MLTLKDFFGINITYEAYVKLKSEATTAALSDLAPAQSCSAALQQCSTPLNNVSSESLTGNCSLLSVYLTF